MRFSGARDGFTAEADVPPVQLQVGGISQVLRGLPEDGCCAQKSIVVDAEGWR